jgi:HK97 family phage portal protein
MAFNFFNRKRDNEDQSRETLAADIGEVQTPSDVLLTTLIRGDKISLEQALTIPAVSANLDFISNCIAAMPVKLYKYKQGKVEEVENDSRTRLLNNDTGDTLDGFQFKKALVRDYLMTTGGYAYIEKYRNDVTGLYYVDNEYVVIDYNFQPINKFYKIYVEDGTYQPHEFIKLLRNTKTGAWGVGILEELNDALQAAYQTQLYQLGLVKTGGNKRGFIKSQKRLSEPAIQALKAAWRKLYANNTENVVVLNDGLDFKEAANTSVEMQLNESIETLGKQIDKIFHIFDNFNDTFKFAIYPIVKAFETALNRDLLLEKEKKNYFFEFDVKEIIKASIKERYEVYRMGKECGMTTINERRRMENMNEIEGGDVIDLGLGSVLYDIKTQKYYVPNMNATSDSSDSGESTEQELKTLEEETIIDHDNKTEA